MNSDERMDALVQQIREDPTLPATLPDQESRIVQAALDGESVYKIAQLEGMSEEAVWELLGNVARTSTNRTTRHPTETGGMGSDTDPGVTGGYGDTALGSVESATTPTPPAEETGPRSE